MSFILNEVKPLFSPEKAIKSEQIFLFYIMFTKLGQTQNQVTFDNNEDEDNKILQIMDTYDKKMINYLGNLYNILLKPRLDLAKLDSTVKALNSYKKTNEYLYLDSLLHPERNRDSRIPSPIPVPSCSFQLHNTVTLTTNSSGNLLACFNPFFLYGELNGNELIPLSVNIKKDETVTYDYYMPQFFSTFFYCNSDQLDGRTTLAETELKCLNFSQGIPAVYDQYRLVSASMVVKYIGRLDIASGVIGGAIAYDENNTIGSYGNLYATSGSQESAKGYTYQQFLAKYTNFDTIIDSFYHQENLCLEGLRQIYFPLDVKFEEYNKLLRPGYTKGQTMVVSTTTKAIQIVADADKYTSGFNFLFYVLGAPPSTANFKVDIYCNFECLPNSSFLNYMPVNTNVCNISQQDKNMAIKKAQEKPVMKLSENPVTTKPVKEMSILERLKEKFGGFLPSIGKMVAKGVISMIPGLKPGLALAGAMLGSNAQRIENNAMQEDDVE